MTACCVSGCGWFVFIWLGLRPAPMTARCVTAVSLVVAGLFLYGGLRPAPKTARCVTAVSRVVAGLFLWRPAACADDCLIRRFSLISGFVYYVVVYRVGVFLLTCSLDSCRRNRCKKKLLGNVESICVNSSKHLYSPLYVHSNQLAHDRLILPSYISIIAALVWHLCSLTGMGLIPLLILHVVVCSDTLLLV